MIETYYGVDQLNTPVAMFAALVIGMAFGFILERAGFGSSRKLAGIFYLKDMTVLKVMFTAVITAMLGLSYALALGWISADHVYALPTVYRTQILGGLLFGVGFVISGWCPGTGAVGMASGKLDAVVFLVGSVIGAIVFNELFGVLKIIGIVPSAHDAGVLGEPSEPQVAFGMPRAVFAFAFTLVAVGAFSLAEWIERKTVGGGKYLGSPFLKTMSLAMVVFAGALFLLPDGSKSVSGTPSASASSVVLLESIESGDDHIEPEELADRLMQGATDIVIVDVRTPAEYAAFHIRGASNVPLPQLPAALAEHKNRGKIVLYSNGMTHPAEARDVLWQLGYRNAYLLTDGLNGFVDRCLKPVSLRDEPMSAKDADRINAWRHFFLGVAASGAARTPTATSDQAATAVSDARMAGLVDARWLAEHLNKPDVRIIDVRSQPKYNTGHIPGSVCLNPESFRGVVGGVSSMLLPADMLARHLSLMGIRPTDTVILIYGNVPDETELGNGVRDATLVGMGLERLGQKNWAILDGGFAKWMSEKLPVTAALPEITVSMYPVRDAHDGFSVDADYVRGRLGDKETVVLDVRPGDFYQGIKSDEARAGHIPGAVNRSFKMDLGSGEQLKPIAELEEVYRKLIPSKDTPVIVHCRTGHQASQTFFVLARLLGYKDVTWYDGGWSEWAARPELPAEK